MRELGVDTRTVRQARCSSCGADIVGQLVDGCPAWLDPTPLTPRQELEAVAVGRGTYTVRPFRSRGMAAVDWRNPKRALDELVELIRTDQPHRAVVLVEHTHTDGSRTCPTSSSTRSSATPRPSSTAGTPPF